VDGRDLLMTLQNALNSGRPKTGPAQLAAQTASTGYGANAPPSLNRFTGERSDAKSVIALDMHFRYPSEADTLMRFPEVDTPRTSALPDHVRQHHEQHHWSDWFHWLQRKQGRIIGDNVHVGRDHHDDSRNYS